MELKEKRAFEPTGLVPRSIVRTFERFRQQLLPGSEKAVIREYRISRYQVLVSVRCLFALLTIPIATNWFVSSWLLSPIIEHLWNTQQNEIFLNSYQEERAFAELEFFSDKLFFESLLSNDGLNDAKIFDEKNDPDYSEHSLSVLASNSLKSKTASRNIARQCSLATNDMVTSTTHINYFALAPSVLETALGVNDVFTLLCNVNMSLVDVINAQSPVQLLGKLPPRTKSNPLGQSQIPREFGIWGLNKIAMGGRSQLSPLDFLGNQKAKIEFDSPYADLQKTEGYSNPAGGSFPSKVDFTVAASCNIARQCSYCNPLGGYKEVASKDMVTSLTSRTKSNPPGQSQIFREFGIWDSKELMSVVDVMKVNKLVINPISQFSLKSIPETLATSDLPCSVRSEDNVGNAAIASNMYEMEDAKNVDHIVTSTGLMSVVDLRSNDSNVFHPQISLVTEISDFKNAEGSLKIKKRIQEKILELAIYYNQQTILSITNVAGDLISVVTLGCLFIWMKPEISILKSFLIEAIYSLSDTTKSFLLILLTDLLVGFHSPRGWETALELLLKHFGLPENQDFVFLFVATFPVLLDTVFKYWIFRHLNKISPSTVATYHSMIE